MNGLNCPSLPQTVEAFGWAWGMIEVTGESIPLDALEAPEFGELLSYWQGIRGDRFAPSWTDVELIELPAKILPYLTVVEVRPQPFDFIYRFCGTGHMTVKARDYTNLSVTQVRPKMVADVMFDQFRRTWEARRPLAFRRVIKGFRDEPPLRHDTLRLPLSADGEWVHWVMSLSDWDGGLVMRDFYLEHGRGNCLPEAPVSPPPRVIAAGKPG